MNLRLVRTLPAYAPRPPFVREDAIVDAIRALTFVPGSSDVIVIGRWGIQRFALDRDEPIWRVPTSARWTAGIAMSPDGERLLTICDDARLVERDAYTGAERWCWDANCHHTTSFAFSQDGNDVLWCGDAIASNPGGYGVPAVVLYDAATQQRRWTWRGEDWRRARGAALVASGVLVAVDGFHVTRLEDGVAKNALSVPSGPLCASRDGRTVLVGGAMLLDEEQAYSAGILDELRAMDPAGAAIAAAKFLSPRLQVVTLEPWRSTTIELADDDLDRVTAVACANALAAAGTNGGRTFVYAITSDASSRTD